MICFNVFVIEYDEIPRNIVTKINNNSNDNKNEHIIIKIFFLIYH